MDFNSLLPLLKILTSSDGQRIFFIFVVSLTFVVAIIRIVLRKDLENLISEAKKLDPETNSTPRHPIIVDAQKRINAYENKADKFNASVIIDQVYSQNKLGIASRDSWDFVCRSFPNVLISLGLLGTFVGITSNLSSIQGILNNSTGTTEQITARLQEPLNGMATAFGSSLIALVCGITLTFVNLVFNTTVAKYRFLSLLEDYLNSKAPSTPTGILLNGIQDSLRSFKDSMVYIFENQIADAIGKSFTSQITKITIENERLAASLNELISGFRESATKISDSSESFKYAASILSSSDLPASINNFSETIKETTSILAETSDSVANSSNQFQEVIERLNTYSERAIDLYNALDNLLPITQRNQESLLEIMPTMQQERETLNNTLDLIHKVQGNLVESASAFSIQSDEIRLTKEELIKLTKNIRFLAKQITDKLHQDLGLGVLHDDNRKLISLLESLTLNPNQGTTDIGDSQITFLSEIAEKINELTAVANLINQNVQCIQEFETLENQNDTYFNQQNDSNYSVEIQQVSQIIESVNAIKLGVDTLQESLNSIDEQVKAISSVTDENKSLSLFPTVKMVLSKRIIGK